MYDGGAVLVMEEQARGLRYIFVNCYRDMTCMEISSMRILKPWNRRPTMINRLGKRPRSLA